MSAWAEIRQVVTDPRAACERLGLLEGSKSQGYAGLSVRCPWHGERNPSCSVTRGQDGTIRAKCFSCDSTGDLWGLTAAVTGEAPASRELLIAGAAIFGLEQLLDTDDRDRALKVPRAARQRLTASSLPPERSYPSPETISAFWGILGPVSESWDAGVYLEDRCIDPVAVSRLDLARAIDDKTELLGGCRWNGMDWNRLTHRIVLPVWDAHGVMASVRGWAVIGDVERLGAPKRLPLSGYSASGLVLANGPALELLRGGGLPDSEIVVVEGEPDFLTWSVRAEESPVFGLGSGWWTQEHANRIPSGCEVVVLTHDDQAGERYANNFEKSLQGRCRVRRRVRL